jgi:predicted DNA-binding transcriptional regulator YafY
VNRIDRISAILIHLQSKKVVKGQDIANRFSISLRTAYRDIKTLEEAGVPIISEAGVGYSLMDGYRLPPVMFTKEEAISFLTAEKLVEKLTDSATYNIYQSALYKIKAVLRNDEKEHLENMYHHIEIVENPYLPKDYKTSNHIQTILNSVSQKLVLTIDYFANHTQQKTTRNIEAVGIFLMNNNWYVIAFCWLRNDYRTFKVDRIPKVTLTQIPFKKQHLQLKTYLKEITKENQDLHKVIICIDKEIIKYIGEQKYYNGFVSEKQLKNKIEMVFLTSSLEGFARWFMMYGDHAEIISPQSLRTRVNEIASQIKNKII